MEPVSIEHVQVAIANAVYAAALRDMLRRSGAADVECVEIPDPKRDGVLVLDSERLENLPVALVNPDRIVLIARNDPRSLARAWEIGVSSVVFENDPLTTIVLAVMSAGLRSAKRTGRGDSQTAGSASAAKVPGGSRETQPRPKGP